MKVVELSEIAKYLSIEAGDTVLVSSDIKKLLYTAMENGTERNLNDLIDGLQRKVGTEGTILFPTYNWDYCKGIDFDYKRTKCKTGALGTIALKRNDFRRTKHPIYSFAVWGRDQDYLCELDNYSSFGPDSPFAYMHQRNAKNLTIDTTLLQALTFVHYVEELSGVVNYRHLKEFCAGYIDETGIRAESRYAMFVRNLDLDVNNLVNPYEPEFIQKGIECITNINGSEFRVIELGKAYPIILDDIINHCSRKLCCFKGQKKTEDESFIE